MNGVEELMNISKFIFENFEDLVAIFDSAKGISFI